MTRREFLAASAAAPLVTAVGCAEYAGSAGQAGSPEERDLIITGVRAAIDKTLLPALTQRAYPGHFTVTANGGYGVENTWPGLDSWQMAGAYLLLHRHREVLDYFDFVQASQRKDGNIPFAIFPGEQSPGSLDSWLRGLRFPQDVYSYQPTVRPGQPAYSNLQSRKWVGLFSHWQAKVNPLGVLGAVSYLLTGSEIFETLKSKAWLQEKIESLDTSAGYVLSRMGENGLIGGAGFYIESPPRNQWDGVTQCYSIYAFRKLANLHLALGQRRLVAHWSGAADTLERRFRTVFWRKDHFAEYVHPDHGLVDSHGLSDVNWAAIGLGIANRRECHQLWPILTSEPAFWRGDMPTHLVTKPKSYERWELPEPLPFPFDSFTNDVAAMGRVWHLEALACVRMRAHERLRTSVSKVCAMGQKHDWFWSERYHAGPGDTVHAAGNAAYCEYPAILVRVVLGNPWVFPECSV